VKAGSVSPALARLADLGLVRYERREYIELTPPGEAAARRVSSRHELLTRFFSEVLLLPRAVAEQDACTIEHGLSNEAMDRLVRLFEFMRACPVGEQGFLARFHSCPLVQEEAPACDRACGRGDSIVQADGSGATTTMFGLRPGQRARILRVEAKGEIRQRLLDMGLLPDVEFELERVAPAGDPIWIRLQGFQLSLRRAEAEAIHVRTLAER
jgi:DtxR family Mn-dependent transcriptional regulator